MTHAPIRWQKIVVLRSVGNGSTQRLTYKGFVYRVATLSALPAVIADIDRQLSDIGEGDAKRG